MKNAVTLTGAVLLALAVARPFAVQPQWDHGSSDSDIFAVIKRGVPPTMMAGFDGRIPDEDIWSIVNYLRTLSPKK